MASRLPELKYEDMTPEQQKAYDLIGSTRNGNVNGPFPAWIRNPELCFRIQSVSDVLRSNSTLGKQLFEAVTIVVARHMNAKYMWGAHSGFAMKAGLPEQIVDDINSGRKAVFPTEKEQLVYEVADTLAAGQTLPIELYNRAVEVLGYDVLIEVATDVGFYDMIACVLNTFDVQPLPGTLPLK